MSSHNINDVIPGEDNQKTDTEWAVCIQAQLQHWLPEQSAACCTTASIDLPVPDIEKIIVANAVSSRQAEFIAGRWCAHLALEKIGSPAALILADKLYGPTWPVDVAGSITHESGICLAVVTRASSVKGIGVDLFDTRRKKDINEISHLILTKEEAVKRDTSEDSLLFTQLAFSAKEAVVKAISKKIGRFLDLREIQLSFDAEFFEASLKDFPDRICGRWAQIGSFLLTFAVLERISYECTVSLPPNAEAR